MECRTKAASWTTGGTIPALLLGPCLPAQPGAPARAGRQLGSRGDTGPRKALPLSTGGASGPLRGKDPEQLGLQGEVRPRHRGTGSRPDGQGRVPLLPQFPRTEQPWPHPRTHGPPGGRVSGVCSVLSTEGTCPPVPSTAWELEVGQGPAGAREAILAPAPPSVLAPNGILSLMEGRRPRHPRPPRPP